MKSKTAMNICKQFRHVYRTGYCDLQYIAPSSMISPQFYNCGTYGWNCDLYCDYGNDAIITTGYRNMRGTPIPQELLDKYNSFASEIGKQKYNSYDEMQSAYYANFEAFIQELNAKTEV